MSPLRRSAKVAAASFWADRRARPDRARDGSGATAAALGEDFLLSVKAPAPPARIRLRAGASARPRRITLARTGALDSKNVLMRSPVPLSRECQVAARGVKVAARRFAIEQARTLTPQSPTGLWQGSGGRGRCGRLPWTPSFTPSQSARKRTKPDQDARLRIWHLRR
jgi:hypothetical protein